MENAIQCECGFEACAADEDALVAEVRRHAWVAHGMPLSRHEALLLVFRAELDLGPSTTEDTTRKELE
jgi:Protein of unknown function (DUF1059)